MTLDLSENTYSVGAVTTDIWGIVGSGVTIQKDDGSGSVAEWGGGAADTSSTGPLMMVFLCYKELG